MRFLVLDVAYSHCLFRIARKPVVSLSLCFGPWSIYRSLPIFTSYLPVLTSYLPTLTSYLPTLTSYLPTLPVFIFSTLFPRR